MDRRLQWKWLTLVPSVCPTAVEVKSFFRRHLLMYEASVSQRDPCAFTADGVQGTANQKRTTAWWEREIYVRETRETVGKAIR